MQHVRIMPVKPNSTECKYHFLLPHLCRQHVGIQGQKEALAVVAIHDHFVDNRYTDDPNYVRNEAE